jgi:predicted acyl esterase
MDRRDRICRSSGKRSGTDRHRRDSDAVHQGRVSYPHARRRTDDVTIAGPVRPSFWGSTSGTDADWVVKVIDVYPDDAPETAAPTGTGSLRPGQSMGGYQQLVRGDELRGKFRNSLEKPEPLVPGAQTHIEFEMLDVLRTFRKGHRIMVQVQSTWFPLLGPQSRDVHGRLSREAVGLPSDDAARVSLGGDRFADRGEVLGEAPKVIPWSTTRPP